MSQSEPTYPRGIIVHKGHTGTAYSVAFSPDGKSVASSSEDKSIRIWDAYRPVPTSNPLKGHTSRIWSICYSPLGTVVVSGSGGSDKTVRLWDTQTGQQMGEALSDHHKASNSVAFSPSGNLIASGSDDQTVKMWSVRGSVAFLGSLQGHTGWVWSIAFSPNNTRIASGSSDKTIRIWDIERKTTVGKTLQGHKSTVHSVSFSPDGSQVASGSFDETLCLWDVRTGSMIGTPFEGHTGRIFSVAFSPNGTYVASASEDKTVRIWDIRTHRQAEEPFEQHTDCVNSVAFSPCGNRVASGSDDSTVMIWNILGSDLAASHDSHTLTGEKNENNEGPKPGSSTAPPTQFMSTRDMFDHLSRDGCVDLTSQIEPELDSSVLRFRDGFGNTWEGELRNRTRVQVRTWRGALIEQCSKETLECAIKDIQTWSKMKHKNVHQLMGVVMPNGQYLGLVTERMENGSLHEYMRNNPSLDRHQMCTQIASGLAYIHQSNMVHGDLKGLNVSVSSGGVAKLSNFGILALSAAYIPFSETSDSHGATRWVAPELLSVGASKSKESDVYALGMARISCHKNNSYANTMLEVITGNVPYSQCKWEFQVLSQVMQGELPPRPVNLQDDESGNQVWALLMSCWNKSPDLRPSAKEVMVTLVMTTTS